MINLFKARMSSTAGEAVTKVLNSGYTGQGSRVEEFEDLLWKELKTKTRPVTVNSCTSALDLALELCEVNAGDEVISTAATCFASQVGILHRKAKIVWADIDPETSLIDSDSVKKLITPKTKAIVSVNWAGKLCDYEKLKSFGIPVIEDAAHTWDVFPEFDHSLERGTFTCYSFQSIKFLQTGDGGCLICPKEYYEKARLLRWFGLDRTKGASFRCSQNVNMAGFKYHMNDIAAAIGISNIEEARDSVEKQRKNSKFLIENIYNPLVRMPEYDTNCSYWILSICVVNNLKDKFSEYLRKNDIESSPVHYRNDLYDCTKEFYTEGRKGVDVFANEQICIPNGWWLTQDELNHIVHNINSFAG